MNRVPLPFAFGCGTLILSRSQQKRPQPCSSTSKPDNDLDNTDASEDAAIAA